MRGPLTALGAALLSALFLIAPAAQADFGLKEAQVTFSGPEGDPAMGAGSHPFEMATKLEMNTIAGGGGELPEGEVEDLTVKLPPGFAGNPYAVPRCSNADFIERVEARPSCSNSSVVGISTVKIAFSPIPVGQDLVYHVPLYNLEPPPGVAAKLGFVILNLPVTVDLGVNPDPPYNIEARSTNIAQAARFYGSILSVWGNPADSAHDPWRGNCLNILNGSLPEAPISLGKCPVEAKEKAFITLPRSCEGPLETLFEALAWNSGLTDSLLTSTAPLETLGCGKLDFSPRIAAQPTSRGAESPTGLDFDLDIHDEGVINPVGRAASDVKKAVVTLPEGVTINPSQAEGLSVCGEAGFAEEKADSEFGEGCPAASKIGTVEVETPLLEGEVLKGSVFVAAPYENPFGSLLALYMTIKHPALGINIRLAGKVEPDPRTGQLITTFDDLPQQPFSHFHFHFREGSRSPLVTPPRCGTYTTEATFTPWADPEAPYTTTSSFEIDKGVGGGSCPAGGTPPFKPGFSAGTLNNDAGAYSPFLMRLTRSDGDQDLTKFSAKLPPGMVAKLAGTSRCPDGATGLAGSKSGRAELASPSCPQSSRIGMIWAGAGVGPALTYVPGKVYMAGPYNGAPLSVIGIVPAVAGPFDVGTVVTRQALAIDPRTALVTVDGERSDPIPHILAGIPLKVRDIQVSVDKPDFTLNPTSCDPFAVQGALWGGGNDVFSSADDSPVSVSDRFQAANCQALGFKPKLQLRLKGGTGRGAHPALRGVFTPRPGDANLKGLVLRLPRSAFLDQAHIRTICTRVQFAAKACPEGAIYGHATAYTPILDQPLQGPVYLRSSNHNLPDFVADLHGLVDVEAVARIDSVKGGIRASFEDVPDAPLSKVVVEMQGAKKGLIVNSRNLCGAKSKANAQFTGQNGKRFTAKPVIQAGCGGGRKAK